MTTTQTLPERPHLDRLRNEAKRRHAILKLASASARLSDAQALVARAYGFTDWTALKAEVERRRAAWCAPPPLWSLFRPGAILPRPSGLLALASPERMETPFITAQIVMLILIQASGLLVSMIRLLAG